MRGFVTELRGSASAVAANRGLRRLAFALVVAELSAPVYFTACGVWAFGRGGAMLAALVGIVALVPAALVAPVAAVLADRTRRSVVLSASLAARAGLLALLAIGIALDATWLVLGTACLASICARIFYPAVAASLPTLARSRDELVAANAVVSGTEHVGCVVGPAFAGAALVLVGPAVVCAAAAVGTLGAALALACLDEALGAAPRATSTPASRRRELTAGFASLLGSKHTRTLVCVHVFHCFAIGALSIAVIQLALQELRVGTAGLGALEGALAVGGIAGGVAALARASTHSTDASVRLGGMLWAVPLGAMVVLVHPLAAVGGLVVAGVGNVLLDVAVYTHVQESTDDGVIARAVAAMQSLAVAAVGVGSLVAGISLSRLGTGVTLLGIGVVVGAPAGALVRRERSVDVSVAPTTRPSSPRGTTLRSLGATLGGVPGTVLGRRRRRKSMKVVLTAIVVSAVAMAAAAIASAGSQQSFRFGDCNVSVAISRTVSGQVKG